VTKRLDGNELVDPLDNTGDCSMDLIVIHRNIGAVSSAFQGPPSDLCVVEDVKCRATYRIHSPALAMASPGKAMALVAVASRSNVDVDDPARPSGVGGGAESRNMMDRVQTTRSSLTLGLEIGSATRLPGPEEASNLSCSALRLDVLDLTAQAVAGRTMDTRSQIIASLFAPGCQAPVRTAPRRWSRC
jgi:hypothetical protein